MTFWDTLGHVAADVANPFAGAFDVAKVAAATEDPNSGPEGIATNASNLGSSFFKSLAAGAQPLNDFGNTVNNAMNSVVDPSTITRPLAWAGNQFLHAATAFTVGQDAEMAQGKDQLSIIWDPQGWTDAWNKTQNVDFGHYAVSSIMHATDTAAERMAVAGYNLAPDAAAIRARYQQDQDHIGFKVAAGAMDIAASWYADPTLGLGKVANIARAGSRIVDGTHAEEIFQAGEKMAADGVTPVSKVARGLGGAVSTAPAETYSRAFAQVAKTDNMSIADTAAHFKPILERTPDAGPIVGILGQASKIGDVALQRQVKMDTVLAAAGSDSARARLIQNAPHIARAVQRASLPPETYQVVDDLFAARAAGQPWGDSLVEAAGKYATPENQAELNAYANQMDTIHAQLAAVDHSASLGGVENVGGSILGSMKSTYRAGMANSFFFQDGPSARGIQALHWATGQRARGSIATDNAIRGHDELVDVMKRATTMVDGKKTQLFTGDDIRATADQWWNAPNQEARSALAQALPERILNRLANANNLSRDALDEMLTDVRGLYSSGRTYTTRAMEEARQSGRSQVILNDPLSGTPVSIDKALFETHIENNVGVPEVDDLNRLMRHYQDNGTFGDKIRSSTESLVNHAEALNDVWRTMTLARPGLVLRTQLDTQARSAMVFGATQLVYDAMKGLGHKITDKLTGEQVQQISDSAHQLARRQDLLDQAGELRNQAALEPGGDHLDRAAALENAANSQTPLTVTGRRIATQPTTINAGGQNVVTRAAESDAQLGAITTAAHTGPQTLSEGLSQTISSPDAPKTLTDVMLNLVGQRRMQFTERSGDWQTVMPDDQKWQTAWVRSTHALTNSSAGKAILNAIDLPEKDAMQALRTNPDVMDAWRAVKGQNPNFAEWLDRAIWQTQWTAPTLEVRDMLRSGEVLTPDAAERMFKPRKVAEGDTSFDHLPDRMPVHAPAMDRVNPVQGKVQSLMDLPRFAVKWMSDQPDTVLGRVPFYANSYFQHFKELAGREVDRAGELSPEAQASIEDMARHRAIMDTRRSMYDTARFTGAHDATGRMFFAFTGAWEDAMRAWSRLFYDDPSRIGKLAKMWYTPERAGMVVDSDGNPVQPGQQLPPGQTKWLTVPVSWMPGVDFKDFRIRKDSFNTIFNGNVPWMPGLAPLTQIPLAEVAAKAFPEIGDPNYKVNGSAIGGSPLWQQEFGMGLPHPGDGVTGVASSIASQMTPGWIKRAMDLTNGNNDHFNDAYGMALNSEFIRARQAGQNTSTKAFLDSADLKARNTARSMMFMDFISNFGLGLSGEGSNTADFYRAAYRNILTNADALAKQNPPRTPTQELARLYPETAGLKWSFSTNNTGINASLNVENRIRKYGGDIQKNPEFGWFYVGSDNVGGQFSAASYAAQFGREAAPGSGVDWRTKMNPAQIKAATAGELGWNDYFKVKDQVDTILAQRGLHSLQQSGAEDLKQVFDNFKTQLGTENPDWLKDYSSVDKSKMERFITQVATPAMKDPRLKNRTDIVAMSQYLGLRQQAMTYANSQGYSLSSQQAAPLRAILDEAGQGMAQENIGFGQMWTRMFQREVG